MIMVMIMVMIMTMIMIYNHHYKKLPSSSLSSAISIGFSRYNHHFKKLITLSPRFPCLKSDPKASESTGEGLSSRGTQTKGRGASLTRERKRTTRTAMPSRSTTPMMIEIISNKVNNMNIVKNLLQWSSPLTRKTSRPQNCSPLKRYLKLSKAFLIFFGDVKKSFRNQECFYRGGCL